MSPDPIRPHRIRRSPAEAASLVADWRASGLNKQAFCRERGILRSTLLSCLTRIEPAAAPVGFVELRPRREPADRLRLEIDGCLAVTGLDVAAAAALIAALRSDRR